MIDNLLENDELPNWEHALAARDDLDQYGSNSLALFALALRFRIDDIHSVATESITDGSDDKKCDLIFIDKDEGVAVISQCYKSDKLKPSAPANKASDLNTAIGWLLQRPIDELPSRLQSSAKELREGIKDGLISRLFAWYVHNLPESNNVSDELVTVESAIQAALNNHFPNSKVQIQVQEIGQIKFNEWYNETLSPILVSDNFIIPIKSGFEVTGEEWSAFVTAIPARFLYRIYKKFKTKLFSANVRDYLGSRKSDANINYGIKQSAENSPGDFWVYNNGLTILVNDYNYDRKQMSIKGLSIVNGAQTTGAIGSLRKTPNENAIIPVRFVKTTNSDLINNIIQFNNSQNKVTASDFRSTDAIQKRLRQEVNQIPDAEYEGGRRGGSADVIRRTKKILPSYTVGQALAAFHQDPVIAYNQKTNIWVVDKLYSKFFNDDISGPHLVFAYSLLRAVEEKKMAIVEKSKKGTDSLTEIENSQLEFFRNRGSTYLLTAAIAKCLESFLGRKITNFFRLSFGETCSPKKAKEIWKEIVEITIPFCAQLSDAFTDGLKNTEKVQSALRTFQSLVQATAGANSEKYGQFAKLVNQKSKHGMQSLRVSA